MTRPGAIRQLLVSYLKNARGAESAQSIIIYMHARHGISEATTRTTLRRLVQDAAIVRLSRGIYRTPL